jgi:hypothetical protein
MKAIAAVLLCLFLAVTAALGRSGTCFVNFGDGYYGPFLAAGGATAWQKGSSITLYIVSPQNGGFTSGQISDIENSLSNWSTALGTNLSITNSIVSSTPSSFPAQYILVKFGDTSACGSGIDACTNFNYDTTTGYPTYSIINVSTSLGTIGIGPLMAHEIGHTYI